MYRTTRQGVLSQAECLTGAIKELGSLMVCPDLMEHAAKEMGRENKFAKETRKARALAAGSGKK